MSACTFFGHHDCPASVKPKLRGVLVDLIENQSVDMFYAGNKGAFDRLVRAAMRELVQEYPHINYAVVLERMPGKQYISKEFPIFLQRHGLKRMRFHDLRHSCASLLLANGVPLKCIQEWLGHSDFTITANIYAHLDYSSKLSSAQAMERGLPLPENDFGSRWVTVGYYDNAKEIAHFLPGALDRKTKMQETFQN